MFKTHRTFDLSRGVKNNTIAVFNDGKTIKVLYHATIVINITNKSVTIDNGGWDTVSTRIVINNALSQTSEFSTCYMFRQKGKTYLYDGSRKIEFKGKLTLKAPKLQLHYKVG